jgi:hypothetical protein
MGRVRRTQDSLGNWTLYGYAALGRQVKVIRNAATPTYNLANDPALASYTPNGTADQDIITQTAYDRSDALCSPHNPMPMRSANGFCAVSAGSVWIISSS